jgi:hypothetical protein
MATDLLEVSDYVTAARGTLARAAEIARALALRLWMPLAVAGVLIGIGWLAMISQMRDYVAGFQRPQGRWRRAWHEFSRSRPAAVGRTDRRRRGCPPDSRAAAAPPRYSPACAGGLGITWRSAAGSLEHSEPPIPRPWPAHPHSQFPVSLTLPWRTAV